MKYGNEHATDHNILYKDEQGKLFSIMNLLVSRRHCERMSSQEADKRSSLISFLSSIGSHYQMQK